MWIRNNGRSTWIVGDRVLHSRDFLETVDDWTQFFADPTIISRVRSKEIEVDVPAPTDLRDWQYYNVQPLMQTAENVGTCILCHAPVDNVSRQWTGRGGLGNSWSLRLDPDGDPANVYYEDPETLVIERRT